VQLDINYVDEHGEVEVPEGGGCGTAGLRVGVTSHATRLTSANGTVVLWVKPDRLSYNQSSTLP